MFLGWPDVKKPILSAYQEDASAEPLPADRPSASVMDVTENLRSKIYSIFCHLGELGCCLTQPQQVGCDALKLHVVKMFAGFENLPGLTTEDYVTLAIIRRYLDFKVNKSAPV